MKKRTKALNISKKTRDIVWKRDNKRCILCGHSMAMPNAHFIPRSKSGLGIEENIVTLCTHISPNNCHYRYDQTTKRKEIAKEIESYLKSKYKNWNKDDLIYKK